MKFWVSVRVPKNIILVILYNEFGWRDEHSDILFFVLTLNFLGNNITRNISKWAKRRKFCEGDKIYYSMPSNSPIEKSPQMVEHGAPKA